MKGCRDVQCLLLKNLDWKPEPDDQPFELDSKVFLTGTGNGSPDLAPVENLSPIRHVSIIPSRAITPTSAGQPLNGTFSRMLTGSL
jgi:hypothetical protein